MNKFFEEYANNYNNIIFAIHLLLDWKVEIHVGQELKSSLVAHGYNTTWKVKWRLRNSSCLLFVTFQFKGKY